MEKPLNETGAGLAAPAPGSCDTSLQIGPAKTNHGFLTRVWSKRHPKGPDMQGECWIGARHFEIAGWVSLSKKGRKYLSLKFNPSPEPGNA